MAVHLHEQIAVGARHKLLEHVERGLGLRLQDLEGQHAAVPVHLDLMLVRKRFQLGAGQLLAQHAAVHVIAALNRRLAAAHGLHHRAREHDAVMRGRALRIRAENEFRRNTDHQKRLAFKCHGHARLHKLRKVDLAAVILGQQDGSFRIQQPERLHQASKHLLNLIQKTLLRYHVSFSFRERLNTFLLIRGYYIVILSQNPYV